MYKKEDLKEDLLKSCSYITNPKQLIAIEKAFDDVVVHDETINKVKSNLMMYVSTAIILSKEFGLDETSIAASLLQHIPLSDERSADFSKKYGNKVSDILKNIAFFNNLKTSKISLDIDGFIQLILSLTNDIRVILILLANKINMFRHIEIYDELERKEITFEVVNYYAPLAHRLGFYKIKNELEDKALRYDQPEIYQNISNQIRATEKQQHIYFKEFLMPIKKQLHHAGLKYEIKTRTKSVPSIYNKMKTQKVGFHEVYDLFAIRIILDSEPSKEKEDCWRTYSLITDIYQPHVERLRDWISVSRPNGYESLHITVDGSENRLVEVQIRTKRMDYNAENGMAAHWRYKEKNTGYSDIEGWLREIRSLVENYAPSQYATLEQSSSKINNDYIFVFTPEGHLRKLKKGATVLDFAFEIHTDVGKQCTGAKVNDLFVPLKHVLCNGDRIEVTTSKNQKPNVDWLNWAITGRALSKIKRFIKEQEFADAEQGKEILLRKLSQLKINYTEEVVKKLILFYNTPNPLALFHGIANETYNIQDVKNALNEAQDEPLSAAVIKPASIEKNFIQNTDNESVIVINDETLMKGVKFAKCCSPMPGDEIFGFVTVSEGIKIHRMSCSNAKEMFRRYGYRTVKADWDKSIDNQNFNVKLRVIGEDRSNFLNDITHLLSNDLKINVKSINLQSENGKINGIIVIDVSSQKQLHMILSKLTQIKGIKKVSREN